MSLLSVENGILKVKSAASDTHLGIEQSDNRIVYKDECNIDYADMTIKQNNFDVFDFLIKAPKETCDAQRGSLIELGHLPRLQRGASHAGETLLSADATLQQRFDNLFAKESLGCSVLCFLVTVRCLLSMPGCGWPRP